MEGPLFQPTMPFRPIPVYGQRLQNGVAVRITAAEESHLSPKCLEEGYTLTKHLNIISQMSHLRSLGDLQYGQLCRYGSLTHTQVLSDMNKFSVKKLSDGENKEVSHAMSVSKQNPEMEHRNVFETREAAKAPLETQVRYAVESDVAERNSVLERMQQYPLIVSCGSPFVSQYGYGRKVFPCPQCRYTTDRRNNLKRHMLTMHQACSKTLECCGIMFATKASLREHAMIFHYHGYTCFYCGRRFCRKALLKRHLSVHNGQKDFVCPVCDYATCHKSNLERHRKVHCRPEVDERKSQDGDQHSHETLSWTGENARADHEDMSNRISSSDSDDESEEINVDSD